VILDGIIKGDDRS